jgi:hypothetical protein
VWSYGHVTVPRHLRDIIITEYGVADLRGQTDEECVKRMLAITDARFIDALVADAIKAKKLAQGFKVPAIWRANTPDAIQRALSPHANDLPLFPFGTEMSEVEQDLAPALDHLKKSTAKPLSAMSFAMRAILMPPTHKTGLRFAPHLQRLGLDTPHQLKDFVLRKMVLKSLCDLDPRTLATGFGDSKARRSNRHAR